MTPLDKITNAISRYGLGVPYLDLAEAERKQLRGDARRLLHDQAGVPTDQLVLAIRFGMRKVWPFTEDFRTFDGRDVVRNITKAKGALATLQRAGLIPESAKHAIARLDDLAEGGDHE